MATATASQVRTAKGQSRAAVSQLKTFEWVGIDKRGAKLKGEELGKNENLVRAELRKRGINPQKVGEKKSSLFGKKGTPVKSRDIAIFSRQIATMMQAGVPLIQSFDIIASGSPNPRLKDMLTKIKQDIEGGSTLAEALGKFPVQFDELYVNLVRAGESAGVLDTVLETVANYKENIEAIKGKIKKAMFYPAAVIAVAIIVSAVLLVYVVPQFEDIFKNFGADLPAFTAMVVGLSRWLVAYWWLVLLGIGGAVFAFISALKRSRKFQHLFDRFLLKLPVVGGILHNSAIARFSRTLAITFKAGVPLVEALDTVSGATGSVVYGEAVKRIRDDVAVGHQLNLSMRQVGVFPPMVVQMTAIGEESGSLDTMLIKVAEFYEAEVNNAVDALSSLMEPFIMVVIGTLVGGLVIAMYLPIFKLAMVV